MRLVLNDDSNFDDLVSDSDFDENDTIEKNIDEVSGNVIINDLELQNLVENENSTIPENYKSLSDIPATSKKEKEKQPQEYW